MTDRRSSSEELLRRWLRGETTRREEAELEEAARDDAFLAEALAGYRGRPEGEHQQRMEALRDRLRAQRRSRHRALPAYWQIAAAVAVLLVGGWLFWQTRQEPQADMALATEAAQAPVEESTAALKRAPEAAFADTMNTPLMADAASERTGTDLAAQSPTGGTLPSQNTRPDPRPAEPVPPAMALREESVAVPEASEADEAANQIATYTPPPPPAATAPAPATASRREPTRPTDDAPAAAGQAKALQQQSTAFSVPARLLTGQVLDESGRPLPAVTVTVPGSARGATTDQDGRFELPLDPASRQIVISYTGFTTEEVTLRPDDENVQVVLGSQVELSEVVATGRTAPRVRMQAEQMASATGEVAQVRPPNGYRSLRRLLQEQKPAHLPGGIVRLSFQLNADGKPVDVDVLEASAPGLGNYVREQLSRQGGWRIVRGQPPVPVTYTIRLR